MGQVELLARRVAVPVRHLAGLQLVRAADAPLLLDEIEREGLRVIGAEGFHVDGRHVTPVMDAILDLSSLQDPEQSVREARRFVDVVAAPALFLEFGVRREVQET